MEAPAVHDPETIDTERVDKGLYRLMVPEEEAKIVHGNWWLSDMNRRSVSDFVHYNYLANSPEDSKKELTLGALLESKPEYLVDAVDSVMGDRPTMTPEEFLAVFLNKTGCANPVPAPGADLEPSAAANEELLQLFRDMGTHAVRAAAIANTLADFLAKCQIPTENVLLALGIYVIQKAHDQGLICYDGEQVARGRHV